MKKYGICTLGHSMTLPPIDLKCPFDGQEVFTKTIMGKP